MPVAIVAALAYAVSDEWHQSFVPGSHGDAASTSRIDGIGIALAALDGHAARGCASGSRERRRRVR